MNSMTPLSILWWFVANKTRVDVKILLYPGDQGRIVVTRSVARDLVAVTTP